VGSMIAGLEQAGHFAEELFTGAKKMSERGKGGVIQKGMYYLGRNPEGNGGI